MHQPPHKIHTLYTEDGCVQCVLIITFEVIYVSKKNVNFIVVTLNGIVLMSSYLCSRK